MQKRGSYTLVEQGAYGPRLWRIRAVQDIGLFTVCAAGIWLLFKIQAALIPVIVALLLAYALEPAIRWMEQRLGVARLVVVIGSMVLLLAVSAGVGVYIVPLFIEELGRLSGRVPAYLDVLSEQYGVTLPGLRDVAKDLARGDPQRLFPAVSAFFGRAGQAVSTLTSILGATVSAVVSVVLTLLLFGVFAARYPRLPSIAPYLPASRREGIQHRLGQVESVFAAYFRGQLLVALFTTTVFSVGFGVSGVPFWFVAAILGGLFSIVPYGQMVGWILAVLFGVFEAQAEGGGEVSLAAVFIGPTITYVAMQSLETFVVTPLVQGSSTRLHPVVVMLAIVAGGSLGGVLGVFLAIPVVALLRIGLFEVGLPALRSWAKEN